MIKQFFILKPDLKENDLGPTLNNSMTNLLSQKEVWNEKQIPVKEASKQIRIQFFYSTLTSKPLNFKVVEEVPRKARRGIST